MEAISTPDRSHAPSLTRAALRDHGGRAPGAHAGARPGTQAEISPETNPPSSLRAERANARAEAQATRHERSAEVKRSPDPVETQNTASEREKRGAVNQPILAARLGPAPLPSLPTGLSAEDALRDALGARASVSGIADLLRHAPEPERSAEEPSSSSGEAATHANEIRTPSFFAERALSGENTRNRAAAEIEIQSASGAAAFLAELRAERERGEVAAREVRGELMRGAVEPDQREAASATAPAAGGLERESTEGRAELSSTAARELAGSDAVRGSFTRAGAVEATNAHDLATRLTSELGPEREAGATPGQVLGELPL